MNGLAQYLEDAGYRARMLEGKLIISNVTSSELLSLIKGLNYSDILEYEAVLVDTLTYEIRYISFEAIA